MDFHNRVVTVFGGNGFLGRYVISRLARKGAEIRVVSRHPSRSTFLKVSGDVGQVVPIAVDIEEVESLTAVLKGADVVINLIGIIYEQRRWSFQKVHVEGVRRIAGICKELGIGEVVHVSAIGADPKARSQYARTKGLGEIAVTEILPQVRILRPSIIFGPEDRFFNLFASLTLMSPLLPLIGGGKTRFQPVYVGDCADAVVRCLESSESYGKIYELGGPQIYTFRELMVLMLQVIQRKRFLYSVPWFLAYWKATFLELFPKPLLTRDQVRLLESDNVVSAETLTLESLGISPAALEMILPTYLERFRPGGRFSRPNI